MGIVHARVDERLIHGQVATVWTHMTDANRIIVVNDEAVHDEMQIGALKLARPAGMKLSILSVEKGIVHINSGQYDPERAFLVTKNIADMRALVEGGVALESINVGNVAPHGDAKAIKKSVYLDQKDIEDIHYLLDKGVKITAQMVPNESDASIETFIK